MSIPKQNIKERSRIHYGTIIFDMQNNLTVSIKGKALASGSKGDMVAVQNADNKKVYYGEIINKNIVRVNI